jgi:ABC-type multidrug transport system fused ATPase/permease subunit
MPGPPSPGTTLAVAFAGLYALALAALLWAVIRRRSQTWILGAFTISAAAAVTAALLAGKRHDYFHYVGQWQNTMAGGDPWDQSLGNIEENPGYGPLFNVFAPLADIQELLPKLLFTLAWLGTALALARLFAADQRLRSCAPLVLVYFVLNPYFWIEIPLYGHFDILPSAALLASVHLVLRRRERPAGAALAAGALLKVLPICALPFLIAAARRRWTALVLAFSSVVLVVEAVAYAIWGTHAVTFPSLATGQDSKLLSIFAFLRADYSPLRLFVDAPDVDWASLPLLLIAGGLLVWTFALRPSHLVVAVLTTFVVVLALYNRGLQQFQVLVFVLVPYLYLTLDEVARRSRLLWTTLGIYLTWISTFGVVYALGGQLHDEPWFRLRHIVGLPTFLLALTVVIVLLRIRTAPLCVPAPARPARPLSARRVSPETP